MSQHIVQVTFPSGKQGRVPFPRTLAVVPLFSLAQRGHEHELATLDKVEVQLGVTSNVRILRWGVGLTAEHQDVLLALLRIIGGVEATLDAEENQRQRLYIDVRFSAKQLLEILRKGYNEENRDWLRRRLDELSRSHLTVLPTDAEAGKWPLFSGCILQLRTRVALTKGVRCSVAIPIEFVQLFKCLGYGQIDLEQRKKLGSSQLARLLQVQIECLKDRRSNTHFDYSVSKWMERTGTKASEANFISDLRKALKRLKEAEFLAAFSVCRGKVQLSLPSPRAAKTQRRLPSVLLDGMLLRLGEEVPSMEELLGEGQWPNPLGIHVNFDGQLEAILRLYPKAYSKRPELPSLLERVRAELVTRTGMRGSAQFNLR